MKCALLTDLNTTCMLHVNFLLSCLPCYRVCNHLKLYGTVISQYTVIVTIKKTMDVYIPASVTINIKFYVFTK